jgi:hypothetical protein
MIQGFSGGLLNRELIYQTDLPSFQRDFASLKTLDHGTGPSITFTRADATTCATFFDANGVLQTAAANVPRFDHDPATGASRGLLIEQARTNSFERSAEFDNAYWFKPGLLAFGSGSVANSISAPDGTTSADLIVQNSATTARYVSTAISVVSGTAYTFSIFAKAKESNILLLTLAATGFTAATRAWFNLSTGSVGSTAGTPTATSIQDCGNGWYRCSISKVATASDSSAFDAEIASADNVSGAYAGDGTSGLYIWGAQLEEGAFPTSYIPTTTAAATRSAEIVQVDPVSSFVNLNEGTLFTEFKLLDNQASSTARGVISLWDGNAAAGGPNHFLYNTFIWRGLKDGSQQNMSSLGYDTNLNKMSFAYSTSGRAASKNGASVITDTGDSSLPAANRLSFGASGVNGTIAFGVGGYSKHIRKIAYWPKRLTNTLLEQLTT